MSEIPAAGVQQRIAVAHSGRPGLGRRASEVRSDELFEPGPILVVHRRHEGLDDLARCFFGHHFSAFLSSQSHPDVEFGRLSSLGKAPEFIFQLVEGTSTP